jgi:predicted acetyltransferase
MLRIIPATIRDYPTIQNMARFYLYDISRSCGSISKEWAMPADGLYECDDFKSYFEDISRKAYLIKVDNELAGFVLLNKVGTNNITQWNMGEFFIIAKFQGKDFGQQVANQIWDIHTGTWEVAVIPENQPAHKFWLKTISHYVTDYSEEIKDITYDEHQPKRIIFSFDTRNKKQGK